MTLRLRSGQALVGSTETGLSRVIARKLRPKWRAKLVLSEAEVRLLAHIPKAEIWIDSPTILRQAQDRLWVLLVPADKADLQ